MEVDRLHTLHTKLLIEREGFSFEVLVSYESIPKFCPHCHFIGHLVGECNSLKKIQVFSAKPSSSKEPSPKKFSKKQSFINANSPQTNAQQNKAHFVPKSAEKPTAPVTVAGSSALPVDGTAALVINRHTNSNAAMQDQFPSIFVDHDHNTHKLLVIKEAAPPVIIPEDLALAIKEVFGSQSPTNNHNPSQSDYAVPYSFSSKQQRKSDKHKPMHHSTSFYTQHSPTPSINRSLPSSHNTFKLKHRHHNQFDPISDLH